MAVPTQDMVIAKFGDYELKWNFILKSPTSLESIRKLLLSWVERKIIEDEAKARGISADDDEIQAAADAFRRARNLHRAEDTHRWLKANGLSVEDLEKEAEAMVLRNKVKNVLTESEVEKYFHEHKSRFDEAVLAHIVVKEEGIAKELLTQLQEDEATFDELARRYSLDKQTAECGGVLGTFRRGSLKPELESKVFAAKAGDCLGPVEGQGTWRIIKVLSIKAAELTDKIRFEIKNYLFQEWLKQKLKSQKLALCTS